MPEQDRGSLRMDKNAIIDVSKLDFGTQERRIIETPIRGFVLISRPFIPDPRGAFQENYRVEDVEKVVGERIPQIVQVQRSYSIEGVLRGMHAGPEDKYIFPSLGLFFAAVTDVRVNSPTFGRSIVVKIDNLHPGDAPMYGYFTRRGIANGFYVGQVADGLKYAFYDYSVTKVFNENTSKGFKFDDSTAGIPWPPEVESAKISDKDLIQLSFEEFTKNVDQKMYE